jgi:hypothetical protein
MVLLEQQGKIKSLGNGVTAQNGSKPGYSRIIWQEKVCKSTGSSLFNAWERWIILRNPTKHRENDNSKFNLQWKT